MPLWEWMYEETDRIIEGGTKIPLVNLQGHSPGINEDQVVTTIINLPPQPPQPTISTPTSSSIQSLPENDEPKIPVVETKTIDIPQPSIPENVIPSIKPKNIVINVEDNAKTTDK